MPVLLSVSIYSPSLGASYDRTHTVLILLGLSFSLMVFSGFTPDVACIRTLFLYMSESQAIVRTYISYTCSSIAWHLGDLHSLAVVNNASLNVGIQMSAQVSVFNLLGIHPGVELLGHVTILCFSFWGNTKLLCSAELPWPSRWVESFLFPDSCCLLQRDILSLSSSYGVGPLGHGSGYGRTLELRCGSPGFVPRPLPQEQHVPSSPGSSAQAVPFAWN